MEVGFHYEDHQKVRHDIVMSTEKFIGSLIQHIPEKQFKMIRYYGAYGRNRRNLFKKHLQSSIEQTKLLKFGVVKAEKILHCPFCYGEIEFVTYCKKPPPEKVKSQKELLDWISENS